jgi:hypothetical protein
MGNKEGKEGKSSGGGQPSKAQSTNLKSSSSARNAASSDGGDAGGPTVTNMRFNDKKYTGVDIFVHSNVATTEIPECVKDLKCTQLILSCNGIFIVSFFPMP